MVMFCPNCMRVGCVKIIDSRMRGNGTRYRSYKCDICTARFTTEESLTAVKKPGDKNYIPMKLEDVSAEDLAEVLL